jgi:hypothetical protein
VSPSIAFSETDIFEKDFINGCMEGIDGVKAQQNRFLMANGASEQLLELYSNTTDALLANYTYREIICSDALEHVRENPEILSNFITEQPLSITAFNLMYSLQNSYMIAGMKGMDGASLATYFEYNAALYEALQAPYCKLFATADLSDQETVVFEATIEAHSKMDFNIVKKLLDFSTLSINKFIQGRNNGENISSLQPLIYDAVQQEQLEIKFYEHVINRSTDIMETINLFYILEGQRQGANEDYCKASSVYLDAIATMPGEEGNLYRELVLHNMFEFL